MNQTFEPWISIFGLPEKSPDWLVASLVFGLGYFFVVLPLVAVLIAIERKFVASVQARIGPSLAGPHGSLQSIADFFKLLQKDRTESEFRENFWFTFTHAVFFSLLAVLPLGSIWVVVDSEMSAFLPVLIAIVLAFGTLMLGLEQGTVYGFFGALRFAAQVIGATLPATVAILCVGLRAGSFQWHAIVESQGAFPLDWNIFRDPFQWLAFLTFFSAGPMLFGLQAFDASMSRSDLNRGVVARLHGIKFAVFRVREVYGLFFWSALAVVLFFGAWELPPSLREALVQSQGWKWIALAEFSVLFIKSLCLVILYYWISVANPRVRADQLTDFSWRVLSPVSLFALLGSTLWMAWRGGLS